jgi:hypothetical protein
MLKSHHQDFHSITLFYLRIEYLCENSHFKLSPFFWGEGGGQGGKGDRDFNWGLQAYSLSPASKSLSPKSSFSLEKLSSDRITASPLNFGVFLQSYIIIFNYYSTDKRNCAALKKLVLWLACTRPWV